MVLEATEEVGSAALEIAAVEKAAVEQVGAAMAKGRRGGVRWRWDEG